MLLRRNIILHYLLLGALLFIYSCEKEISKEIPGNKPGTGNSAIGDLLIKTVERTNQDSIVTLYQYDAARRWLGTTSTIVSGGSVLNHQFIIVRNAEGIITKRIHKDAARTDSVYFMVNYNSTLSRYESMSSNNGISTAPFLRDSVAFQYDNTQKIAGYLYYTLDFPDLLDVTLVARIVFSRDARGNIISEKIYQLANGGQNDSAEVIYKYDDKVRPLQLSDGEALVTQQAGLYAVNNTIFLESFESNGVPGIRVEKKFVYNSLNKPVTGVSTLLHDNNKKIFLEFYYQ